jgi:hypothetical protein
MVKYKITWYTQLNNGLVNERTFFCKNKSAAHKLYDKLAKEDKTLSIEMEEL